VLVAATVLVARTGLVAATVAATVLVSITGLVAATVLVPTTGLVAATVAATVLATVGITVAVAALVTVAATVEVTCAAPPVLGIAPVLVFAELFQNLENSVCHWVPKKSGTVSDVVKPGAVLKAFWVASTIKVCWSKLMRTKRQGTGTRLPAMAPVPVEPELLVAAGVSTIGVPETLPPTDEVASGVELTVPLVPLLVPDRSTTR
jgi:hypothetical protein